MSVGHKSVIGLWVSACAAVGVVVPQAFGQAAPTGTTAKPASAANKAKSVQALLQQGIDALSAGQYQPAREAFQDVVTLDPRNAKAQHGLALCMMAQKEIAKEIEAKVYDALGVNQDLVEPIESDPAAAAELLGAA